MSQSSPKKKVSIKDDDEYSKAVQLVVDEAMRIDNIAPVMLNAIQHDVPLREEFQNLVVNTISEKQSAKNAIGDVVDQNSAIKRNKIIIGLVSLVAGAIITGVVSWIIPKILSK